MTFAVNVLLTVTPGLAMKNCTFASTVVRFLSRVSYLPSDPMFFFADAVALLRESYTFVRRNSHVFLALSDRAYVSGARCIGFFLL